MSDNFSQRATKSNPFQRNYFINIEISMGGGTLPSFQSYPPSISRVFSGKGRSSREDQSVLTEEPKSYGSTVIFRGACK